MTKQTRKKFSKEQKRQAIDDYVSGRKSAQQIADELSMDVQYLYRWKVQADEKSKGIQVEEFEKEGCPPEWAKRLSQKEEEISLYQKKLAEQAIIIDLLKKARGLKTSASESELSGLIATTKKLDRKKGPAK